MKFRDEIVVLFQTKLIQESPGSIRGSFSNKTDSRNSEINQWFFFKQNWFKKFRDQIVVFVSTKLIQKFRDRFVVLFKTELIQEIPSTIRCLFPKKTSLKKFRV